METFRERTGQQIYLDLIKYVRDNGRSRSPRGVPTLDVGFVVIELESPYSALPLGCGRDLSRNVAAAEAVQLVGGFSSPRLVIAASPNFQRYAEPDNGFHGAYGARIQNQCISAVNKIMRDPDTRQAVITLWDSWLDNLPNKQDYPCTVALQFEVGPGDELEMNVIMRSSDVWLGLPYDMFQFTQLQLSVARSLRLNPGRYRHTTLSLHLYERDVPASYKLHAPTDLTQQPGGFGAEGMSFVEIMKRARQTTTSQESRDETWSERWYRERFASYMG